MVSFYFLATCLAGLVSVQGQSTSSFNPARPPAIPLAVKSPYLNAWLNAGSDGGNGGYLAGQWPVHWSNQITGWGGMIRVDGTAYKWMGDPLGANGPAVVDQNSYEYTSTRSIFNMNVGGKVAMNITFLSPITPDDFQRQSLVFAYLNVEVSSIDGSEHDVQLYSDISAEWVTGDRSQVAQWEYDTSGDLAYHKVYRQTQQAFSENADQAEWGNWYYATDAVDGLTFQSGSDDDVRSQFVSNGKLSNTKDTNFRAVNNDWPVMGFAVDLGSVNTNAVNTLFTIGLCQQDAIQFAGSDGYLPRQSLWLDYFSDDVAALSFFHKDYSTSSDKSTELDNKISSDAIGAAGQDYLTITSLSVRQVFASIQLVGTKDKHWAFLKEISSNGNMNTVDVIFPAHPLFLYTNPELLKLVMAPLFENQESGQYPNDYAIHDLGAHYPNATGHPDGNDEPMPLEECGNMLIMVLAYYQRTQDLDYLNTHYDILRQWTTFLVDEALYPNNQLSTDDFAGTLANQTNLALKGIIGIEAMSKIADLTGHSDESSTDHDTATSYIDQWQKLAVVPQDGNTPAHTNLAYNDAGSHGLLYNLYADSELSLNLVPQEIYDQQSAFYPTVERTYGVPLDTRNSYTKTDWEMFVAAIASQETRDMFHSDIAKWINESPTNRALTDLYETETGNYPSGITFVARPVMGGTFALLLLNNK
ncbi:Six-hairpin glycosidase-like protein [Lasiodiplodia theobromae]|uniref:Glutaminase A n=1 Tax=Lasiodiplodia theobromae TaxID=45133 RepID=A0A5N5D3Y0_9PEZI|nr:Glutaminase A [Lasiodiplodia theobromae]KAF9632842.1 Six-hairpin glycosidase-like protein [Lasiodiplodia theobromae]